MARILMVSSEAAPFAKTGGLGDVLGGKLAVDRLTWAGVIAGDAAKHLVRRPRWVTVPRGEDSRCFGLRGTKVLKFWHLPLAIARLVC